MATVFFPKTIAQAKENEFYYYKGTNVPLKTVRLRPHFIGYQTKVKGQRIDGLAYYDAKAAIPFRNIEVALPLNQQKLTSTMLNWYLPAR